ncbi:MAG: acyl-CoA dehydrogenase family protein, partial [Burkholderiaceae bacterium]
MNFDLTQDQKAIRDAVAAVCADFPDAYWLQKDREGGFPHDFYAAVAGAGWLGVAMPTQYGGAGLGIAEAALMMQAVAGSGAGMSGASAIHMNVFGLHPVVVHGSDEQKRRWLPPIISGEKKACFGVTEPNTGLNTLALKTMAVRKDDHYVVHGQKIWISTAQVAHKILLLARTTPQQEATSRSLGLSLFYTDLDRSKIEVREIDKLGRKAVDSNQLFIDGLEIPVEDRIGEEGRGFEYILHGLNPERILLAAEATGLGRVALQRAARYAGERIV